MGRHPVTSTWYRSLSGLQLNEPARTTGSWKSALKASICRSISMACASRTSCSCGADASWQTGVEQAAKWGLDNATAVAWGAGHKTMMRTTTEALADGVLLGKDPWEVGDYVNGALHEGCAASNDTINTLRNLTALAKAQGRRLIYQCHANSGNTDEVAAFLVGAGEYHYFGKGGWNGVGAHGNFSEHWMEGIFGRRLGEPLADATYDVRSSTWSRSFKGGTRVVFNARTNTGNITWEDRVPW